MEFEITREYINCLKELTEDRNIEELKVTRDSLTMDGNIGIQTSSIVEQGISSEAEVAGAGPVKELTVAYTAASILTLLIYVYIHFVQGNMNLSLSFSISLFIIIVYAFFFGTLIPLFLNGQKGDQAVAAGFLMNDITGLFICFVGEKIFFDLLYK